MTDLPTLPALLKFDEVHRAAGDVDRGSLWRKLKRLGAFRRVGNERPISSTALAQVDPELYQAVVRRRMLE